MRAADIPGTLASALLALVLAACGEQAPAPPPASTQQRGAVPPGDDLGVLEDLAHVGYVDYAEPDAETGAGVVAWEKERAAPGYTLVTSLPNSQATLFDLAGHALRTWVDPKVADSRWSRALILRNGDVLCLSPKADYLRRTTFDGQELWRIPLEVHHDGIELPDGRLLVLTRRFRSIPAIDAQHRSVDNLLSFVSADGKLAEEHSLYDLLEAEPRVLKVVRPAGLGDLPAGYNIDPIHANTVFWLSDPGLAAALPAFQVGRVLVTIRYLDAVALFDLAERRCVWAWGPGLLQGPHDASLLANGHVLVLDNGYDARPWSRVVEYDPAAERIVWEYRAEPPERFHTSGRGTVQALPNGDVLVGNSNSGEAFEVDREGRIVWRFLNPLRDENGARGVIRVERYEAAFVEPLLARFPAR
jgi:hypothetical protein